MSATPTERRALQLVVAIACLVPLAIGGISIVRGPGWLGHAPVVPADLDSQFRYVSGIFFALGLAFTTCVPVSSARAHGSACSACWWQRAGWRGCCPG